MLQASGVPRFSVIIPLYNRRNLIERTLRSVINQTTMNHEIIVVDDGSKDGSAEIVEAFGAGVRLLRQQNKGPGAARNLGARHASGEYLAFLDSDDLWFAWTTRTYERVIEETGRPAFIAGSPAVFREESELSNLSGDYLKYEGFKDHFSSGDEWRWFSASSFVVRRDSFETAGGFEEHYRVAEDLDLTLKLGTEATFVQVRSPRTFGYREHPASLKADLSKGLEGQQHIIRSEIAGAYPGGSARKWERRAIIARHARPVSVACAAAGRFADAWRVYSTLFWWHVALRRWKYLLGLPERVVMIWVRQWRTKLSGSRQHSPGSSF